MSSDSAPHLSVYSPCPGESPATRVQQPVPQQSVPQQSSSRQQTSPQSSSPRIFFSERDEPTPLVSDQNPLLSVTHPEETFEPSFRVDRFYWPAGWDELAPKISNMLQTTMTGIHRSLQMNRKIIGLVSGSRQSGCTTILMSIIQTLAQTSNQKILAIDANLRVPEAESLASQLNLAPEFGWNQALTAEIPLQEAVIESDQDRLSLLPWKATKAKRGPQIFDNAVECLHEARNYFDALYVDCGQLVSGVCYNWLESVIIVEDDRQENENVPQIIQTFKHQNITVLGVIRNFIQE